MTIELFLLWAASAALFLGCVFMWDAFKNDEDHNWRSSIWETVFSMLSIVFFIATIIIPISSLIKCLS